MVTKKEFKRFTKKEMLDLIAQHNLSDIQFTRKTSKVVLVDKIFKSKKFKEIRSSITPKAKRKLTDKQLKALQRNRNNLNKKAATRVDVVRVDEVKGDLVANANEFDVLAAEEKVQAKSDLVEAGNDFLKANQLSEVAQLEIVTRVNEKIDEKIKRGEKADKLLDSQNPFAKDVRELNLLDPNNPTAKLLQLLKVRQSERGIQASPQVSATGAQIQPLVAAAGVQAQPAVTGTGIQARPQRVGGTGIQAQPVVTGVGAQVQPSASDLGTQIQPVVTESGVQSQLEEQQRAVQTENEVRAAQAIRDEDIAENPELRKVQQDRLKRVGQLSQEVMALINGDDFEIRGARTGTLPPIISEEEREFEFEEAQESLAAREQRDIIQRVRELNLQELREEAKRIGVPTNRKSESRLRTEVLNKLRSRAFARITSDF